MNYIRLILGLFIFFCTSITSFAQWNKINQPYGYNIHSSYIDKKGNLFIENEDSIYYSTDSGDSWSNIGGYFTDDLRFLIETDNGDIYRKSVGTLFKFNKLTKTFEFFYQSTALINIDNQGWIWLYAYNGFYISKDNGQNFENINLGYDWSDCQYFSVGSYKNEYKLFMERCSSNSGLLYKIDSNGFTLVSNVPIGIGYFYINPNTGTIFVSNADSMYRSANTGESFAPMIPRSKKYELSYFATLDNGDLIIKDYDLRYSKNDGLTWNNISENYISGPPAFNDINSSGFVNASDTIVSLIGTCKTQGVYKSTDKGANWGVINDNLSIPVVDRYVEDAIGNLYAFTCSDTSILKTSDKGKSWSKFIINYKGNAYSVSDIAVNSRGEIFATTPGFVFKSVDNGSSFIELNVPQAKLYPTAFNIYARNNFVYLLNPYFSLFSKNNGNTWWQTNLIFPGSSKYQININGDLYFSQSGFELYRYSAAKDYVEFVSMNILNFDIVANGYIYFMNWGKAYVSKDNMKTNTQINIPYDVGMYNPIYLYSDDNNDIYFQYANYPFRDNLYVSADNGQTFDSLSIVLDPNFGNSLYISPFYHLYSFSKHALYKYDLKFNSRAYVDGTTFFDKNKDCLYDNIEYPKALTQLIVNGQKNFQNYSGFQGEYRLRLPEGNYTISMNPPNQFWDTCHSYNVNLKNGQQDLKLDFGLKSINDCPYTSVQVQVPIMRKCFENSMYIKYCNEGSTEINNASLKLTLNDFISIQTSSFPYTKNGLEFNFDLGYMPVGFCGDIKIGFKLSCDVNIGDLICIYAQLEPKDTCSQNLPNLSDVRICMKASGSLDPNDKMAFIKGEPADGHTKMNEDIDYLIRFQNTGNDTAFKIVVVDVIPNGFNILSLKPLNSSHPYSIEIENERTVKFIFDPIMLPDSNVNEQASHGFIAFRLSPDKDLSYGTKLDNYADIYFDNNIPVKTNTEYLTVTKITSSNEPLDNLMFNYFPNPTRQELTIQLNDLKTRFFTLIVTDLLGNRLIHENCLGSNYQLKAKKTLLPGIYFLHIVNSEGKYGNVKFVVE